MINRVENQPFMPEIPRQVRFIKKVLRDGQSRLTIASADFAFSPVAEIISQPEQSLRGNDRGGTVHGFVRVERVGGSVQIILQPA